MPFNDELCISVVARHLANWRYLDCKGLAAQLGLGLQLADPAAPGPVGRLAEIAFKGVDGAVAARRFLMRHTLLPYFLAYASPAAAKAQLARLAASQQRNLRTLRLEAMGYARPSVLRVCIECIEHDWQRSGQPYWRRQHQLPGISLCAIHGTRLRDSRQPAMRIRWLDLKALELTSWEAGQLPVNKPFFARELEVEVARESLAALKGGSPGSRYVSTKIRRQALAVLGYGTNAQIAATRLVAEFEHWVSRQTVNTVALGPQSWATNLFTARGALATPLQQILFRQFIQDRLAAHDVFAKWAPVLG